LQVIAGNNRWTSSGKSHERADDPIDLDDAVRRLESLKRILADDFDVNIAGANEAEALPEIEWVQIMPRDRRMPDTAGVEFLKPVREQWPAAMWHIVRSFDPCTVCTVH